MRYQEAEAIIDALEEYLDTRAGRVRTVDSSGEVVQVDSGPARARLIDLLQDVAHE